MFKKLSFVFSFSFLLFLNIHSQVRLPRLISDGMVLQRENKINIWGWASAGEKVTVRFIDATYNALTDSNGNWEISLPPLKAGGPYTMEIEASNKITIKDILIGEVWVCSGQSQMDINMERVSPLYQKEIAEAGNPHIRNFVVPTTYNFNQPQTDIPSGSWAAVTKENILKISAIAYFYSCELYNKYKVPVGMIRTSWGGSPTEAWLSEKEIQQFPDHYAELLRAKNPAYIDSIQNSDRTRVNNWFSQLAQKDEGYKNSEMPWYKPDVDIADWKQMNVPGYWADGELGMVNGIIWFRKDIDIPEKMDGKPAKLNLGRLVDADSVFVNGIFVGTTSYMYPPRRYNVPANVLKVGKNSIVVKIISNGGRGGFVPDKPYELIVDGSAIDLKGEWNCKVGAVMEPLRGETTVRFKPTGLYNAMIYPLSNYTIKGVLWYQGESNADKPKEYARLLPALVRTWRESWHRNDLPFLLVQLPNYMEPSETPSESNWALAREVQAKVLNLPNTGMAVAIDLGEWNDIHPLNKKDVAKRLTLAAYKVAYNENLVYSGPNYKSMEIKDNKIILTFTNTGSGLISKGSKELRYFAISGADKKFVWAKAEIKGDKIIVWDESIKNPVAVRYAWANNPEGANLYNKEGLPASPFRTDNFE
jgi:sialate O-acetylesterase